MNKKADHKANHSDISNALDFAKGGVEDAINHYGMDKVEGQAILDLLNAGIEKYSKGGE